MKRITIAIIIILLMFPVGVLASENQDSAPVSITVVVPRPEDNNTTQAEPAQPALPYIYPIHVWESNENNRREIVRVFELRENETSAQIPRQPFERDGFRFELAEIIRRDVPTHSTRPHTEVVEVTTQSNDLATILGLLNSTIDFVSPDGYFGILALDVSSIRVQSQGIRSSTHNVTRTREFPNLSVVDTSLIPRTITENGRVYSLTNVDWQAQNTTVIDHTEIPNRFTAVATFTGTATRTTTIGYTTTAEYVGQLSRLSEGRTEFTAHFIGIPIATLLIQPPEVVEYVHAENSAMRDCPPTSDLDGKPSCEESSVVETQVAEAHDSNIDEGIQETKPIENTPLEDVEEQSTQEIVIDQVNSSMLRYIAFGLLFVLGMVLAFFAGRKGKAMLNAVKNPACILLVVCMILGMAQVVYAVDIPRYGFGLQDGEPAMHFDNHVTGESRETNEVIHFNPQSQHSGNVMRYAPCRASPGYVYGETIGVLTVERLGRTVNVIAGATMETMDYGGGHFSFTGLNHGNTGLIGHNRGPAGFFSFVRLLEYGDILTLEAGGITRQYIVTMRYIVHETDLGSLKQFGDNRLTLVTCVEYQRPMRRIAVAVEI